MKLIYQKNLPHGNVCDVSVSENEEGDYKFHLLALDSFEMGVITLSEEDALRLADAIQVECLRRQDEINLARRT